MINNLVCPYCDKPITKESFKESNWQCQECIRLLDYETFKKYEKHKNNNATGSIG
jgi:ribosomal protein L37AE/L43A